MKHLRFSDLPFAEQRCALKEIVRSYPELMDILARARELKLANYWIVSGAIYNNVWNYLTERPYMHGVKDVDIFYFDPSDLSYEAEDAVIKRADEVFSDCVPPVEVRNQARVHLWYKDHFGEDYSPLMSSEEGIDRFASITHAVGMRLDENDQLEVYAPYGLNEIFSFRITPNYVLNNKDTHHEKGARAQRNWPEVSLVPWASDALDRQLKRQAS
ncbi:nucleotidyltransferase family protein [Maritalea sp.]|uniref:nucleotidyltransferase family protein n=1 Tax=Maritalea sp. TaxID=2003361 RepID=UPI003EF3A294